MNAQQKIEKALQDNNMKVGRIWKGYSPFTMQTGETLAEIGARPVVGLVGYGEAGGQVLVLADVSILGLASFVPPERDNFDFLRNLARYARIR